MSTHVVQRAGFATRTPTAVWNQVRWFGGGLVLAFAVPFVFADVLDLPRDVYYGIYTTSVVGFFILWAHATRQPLPEMFKRRWRVSLVLGAVFAGLLALLVLQTEETTSRPDGLELVGAVVWRGIVYGLTDGLLLSVFPILAVYAAFAGTKRPVHHAGRLILVLAALAASLTMTAVYHVGYSDFRSEKVRAPLAGDVVWSVPTLLTLNPIGAPIAHAGLHTSAVLHSYETDTFLPPHE
jgi:hypothetical protein